MNCFILSDNRSFLHLNENDVSYTCYTEHGLCVYLETERHRLLLDTGSSDLFLRNAERLNLNLSKVDYVFISHGHKDHLGGLESFLKINKTAKVIMSPKILGSKYYSERGALHSITCDSSYVGYSDQFIFIEENRVVDSDLHVITQFAHPYPMPKANHLLKVKRNGVEGLFPDDFVHEMALYIDGLLYVGCAHNGLLNIMNASPQPLHCVLGGFHLLDGFETLEELEAIAEDLMENYPDCGLITGHCTGSEVLHLLRQTCCDIMLFHSMQHIHL